MSPSDPVSLADIQADFTAALFSGDDSSLRPHLPPGLTEAEAAGLIEIYRNNLIASLIEALRAAFPVSEQFVGKAFFSKLGKVFLTSHPPQAPRLSAWGGAFAPFLASFPPVQQAPALPEIAGFEWAQQVAWFAPDTPPVTAADLQSLAPEDLLALPLGLHPSVTVIASPAYPAATIWERHQQTPVSLKDLPAPPPGIAIWRRGLDVVHRPLSKPETALLTAFRTPGPLAEIAERAALDPITLQATLGSILQDALLARAI